MCYLGSFFEWTHDVQIKEQTPLKTRVLKSVSWTTSSNLIDGSTFNSEHNGIVVLL